MRTQWPTALHDWPDFLRRAEGEEDVGAAAINLLQRLAGAPATGEASPDRWKWKPPSLMTSLGFEEALNDLLDLAKNWPLVPENMLLYEAALHKVKAEVAQTEELFINICSRLYEVCEHFDIGQDGQYVDEIILTEIKRLRAENEAMRAANAKD